MVLRVVADKGPNDRELLMKIRGQRLLCILTYAERGYLPKFVTAAGGLVQPVHADARCKS